MKKISTALAAHLAKATTKIATCWLINRRDNEYFGFTNSDRDIVFDLGASRTAVSSVAQSWFDVGNVNYRATSGYTDSDIATSSELNVDSLEVQGALISDAITEDDIRAGKWDFARFIIFAVNWSDLTMGSLVLRSGNFGRVSTNSVRGFFKVELNGLMQAYTRTRGRILTPTCPWKLGDSHCLVDLTPFTYSGTIESVNTDGLTFYDSTRVEAGPSGSYNITGITSANPGRITFIDVNSPPLEIPLTEGMVITISGVVGPALLNTTTVVRNLTGSTFDLGIDTTNQQIYPPYVSGGTISPAGFDSGYFDHGVVTFTSGLNIGLSMEVKAYVPGLVTLQLPMPYDMAVGDTYTIVAGDDKTFTTCKTKFNNVPNFGGFPYVPGTDKLVAIGKGSSS